MGLRAMGYDREYPWAIFEHDTLKHLCGYIGVGPSHPWFGKDDHWIGEGVPNPLGRVDVHGGITYAQHEDPGHASNIALYTERRDEHLKWLRERSRRPVWVHRLSYYLWNLCYKFPPTRKLVWRTKWNTGMIVSVKMWERFLKGAKRAKKWDSHYPCRAGDFWWVGFDCAHSGDVSPGAREVEKSMGWSPLFDGVYRDEAYARREIDRLVEQAIAAAAGVLQQ